MVGRYYFNNWLSIISTCRVSWGYGCYRVWYPWPPKKPGRQPEARCFTLFTQSTRCVESVTASLLATPSRVVLGGMFTVAETAAAAEGGINFKLKEGFSAETSGILTLFNAY